MPWTKHSPHPTLLLASLVALLMSCGPQQVGSTTSATAVTAEQAMPAPLLLPTIKLRMVATMSLIRGSVAQEIRAKFERPQEDQPVSVTFRLGPKMASRTFEISRDGEVDPAILKKMRRMFRCRRSGRTHRINPGLLTKIADLAEHYEGHTLEIISAYRHGHNAKPSSRHRHGRAIDIRVVGVPAAQVRDYLWARYDEEVGVGFYKQQQFVHLDHRKNYPATAWTQKRHSAENEYNPRWARSSRRSKLVVALVEDES